MAESPGSGEGHGFMRGYGRFGIRVLREMPKNLPKLLILKAIRCIKGLHCILLSRIRTTNLCPVLVRSNRRNLGHSGRTPPLSRGCPAVRSMHIKLVEPRVSVVLGWNWRRDNVVSVLLNRTFFLGSAYRFAEGIALGVLAQMGRKLVF